VLQILSDVVSALWLFGRIARSQRNYFVVLHSSVVDANPSSVSDWIGVLSGLVRTTRRWLPEVRVVVLSSSEAPD
jgi:hypothetical protein